MRNHIAILLVLLMASAWGRSQESNVNSGDVKLGYYENLSRMTFFWGLELVKKSEDDKLVQRAWVEKVSMMAFVYFLYVEDGKIQPSKEVQDAIGLFFEGVEKIDENYLSYRSDPLGWFDKSRVRLELIDEIAVLEADYPRRAREFRRYAEPPVLPPVP